MSDWFPSAESLTDLMAAAKKDSVFKMPPDVYEEGRHRGLIGDDETLLGRPVVVHPDYTPDMVQFVPLVRQPCSHENVAVESVYAFCFDCNEWLDEDGRELESAGREDLVPAQSVG